MAGAPGDDLVDIGEERIVVVEPAFDVIQILPFLRSLGRYQLRHRLAATGDQHGLPPERDSGEELGEMLFASATFSDVIVYPRKEFSPKRS